MNARIVKRPGVSCQTYRDSIAVDFSFMQTRLAQLGTNRWSSLTGHQDEASKNEKDVRT